jgi:SAM-dependent methyltransferase
VKLPAVWPGGILYECNHCSFVFRYPIRDRDEYIALYKSSPEEAYHHTFLRYDQELVRDAILKNNTDGGSVLDIGCFNGALLNSLGARYEKYGIEASEAACAICRLSNINIVAGYAEMLCTVDRKFDVICLVDVVEHLINPLELIKVAITKLNDGGRLIITTGNASNYAWKLFGGRYWYCSFPEHISFISPAWLNKVAVRNRLLIQDIQYFPHINPNIGKAEAWFRFFGRLVKATIEGAYTRIKGNRSVSPKCKLGFPGVINDHLLVILQIKH